MPPIKPVAHLAANKETPSPEARSDAGGGESSPLEDDDAGDDDDLPADPVALREYAKRTRTKLRRAERKMADAGLTRTEERSLANEIARLVAKLEHAEAAAAGKPAAVPAASVAAAAAVVTPADDDDGDDCPWSIL